MMKTLTLSEVKTRVPELVAGVQEREEEVVVTKIWMFGCYSDQR